MALFSKPLFTTLFLSSLSTTFQDISVFSDLLRIGLRYMWWGDTTQHSFWMWGGEKLFKGNFFEENKRFRTHSEYDDLWKLTAHYFLYSANSYRKSCNFFVVFYATVFFFYRYDGKKSFAVGQLLLYMRAVFYFERDCLARKMLYYLDYMHRPFFRQTTLQIWSVKKLWTEP